MCDFLNDWKWFTYSIRRCVKVSWRQRTLQRAEVLKSGHLTIHDQIIPVQEYTFEKHFIVYFIFTTQKFTKSKTKIKISSNDRKMGMEGGLDSTNQHNILWQVVIPVLHPANLNKSSVPSLMFTKFCPLHSPIKSISIIHRLPPRAFFFRPARLPGNLKG